MPRWPRAFWTSATSPRHLSVTVCSRNVFETGVSQTAEAVVLPQPAVWQRPVPLALAASLLTAVVIGLVAWSLWPRPDVPRVTG
jgi:hypothetical protein